MWHRLAGSASPRWTGAERPRSGARRDRPSGLRCRRGRRPSPWTAFNPAPAARCPRQRCGFVLHKERHFVDRDFAARSDSVQERATVEATVPAIVCRIHETGNFTDWWRLEPQTSRAAWSAAATVTAEEARPARCVGPAVDQPAGQRHRHRKGRDAAVSRPADTVGANVIIVCEMSNAIRGGDACPVNARPVRSADASPAFG